MPAELASRYRDILSRIRIAAGDRPVILIAVSKTRSAEEIQVLYELGQRDFGENYAQEILEKAPALESLGCPGIRWHMIGHLQTNKVKPILPFVSAIHSVDSEKLAAEISKRCRSTGREAPMNIFIEVNIDHETSKAGVMPEDAPELATHVALMPELHLAGLMCIPSREESSGAFKKLRDLELTCRPATHGGLSMGMTQDFEEAILQGATHVRVGTALFGPRL